MIAKVRLTYSVELFVKADSEDQIQEWLNENTPEGALIAANGYVTEDYDEEILCVVDDNSKADVDIREVK